MAERPEFEPTIELERFHLSAPCPGVEGKYSYFRPGWWQGNPRFTVFLNHPDYPKGQGIITAAFDAPHFAEVLNQLEDIVYGRRQAMHVEQHRLNKDTKEMYLDNTVRARRGDDGIIAIAIIKKDMPQVAFKFKPSPYHKFKNADDSYFTDEQMSNVLVKGMIDVYRRMTQDQALRLKPPYEPNQGKSGGGNQSKGGYNRSKDDMFDDV